MSTNLDEFVALVREYVDVVNRAGTTPAHAFLRACALILPRIYATGLNLPDVEPRNDDATLEVASPLARIRRLLGRYDAYWEIFDPYVDGPPLPASLATDLADIYLDLATSLIAFDAGHTADAVWQWRFNIQGHCGAHLVDALRAIHRAVNDHMPPGYVAGSEATE